MRKKLTLLMFGVLWTCLAGRGQTVDCLVALVNGQPVTLEDLKVAQEFGLFANEIRGRTGDTKLIVLDALIDQKAVLEIGREPVPITKADLDKALEALRAADGAEAFQAKLVAFGLREDDLRPHLEDRLRFQRIVSARFGGMIAVSRADVEKYYQDVYAKERRSQGVEPEPLARVQAEVEAGARERNRAEKQAEWVKSVRGQASVRINKDCLK